MLGQAVSHYQILEKLGGGAMGVVYKAVDTRLGRPVALKFLSEALLDHPGAVARFRREAQMVSALNHPHICVLYDIGEHEGKPFLAMEFLEGETLKKRFQRGPLSWQEAVELSLQVASALAAAHEKGIVHRDLKPANLFLTSEGRLKVLDFGLAKETRSPLLRPEEGEPTLSGSLVGTFPYMSPEQIQGGPVDARSDLFSLGVVLYEMITGRHPFQGETTLGLLEAILHDRPEPLVRFVPQVPAALQRILERLLAKDPAQRYPSAQTLKADLEELRRSLRRDPSLREVPSVRSSLPASLPLLALGLVLLMGLLSLIFLRFDWTWWKAPEPPRRFSVLVLPFDNLSGRQEEDYFADGMTDALITRLAQMDQLAVVPWETASYYKEHPKPLEQMVRELKVDAVVEASLVRSPEKVELRARLIDAETLRYRWVRRYEQEPGDVLRLQNELAEAVALEILGHLSEQQKARLEKASRIHPEAFDAYLRGRYFLDQRSKDAFEKAIAYFRRAIELDPDQALPYAGLAEAYTLLASTAYALRSPLEVTPLVRENLEQALALDKDSADVHTAKAFFLFSLEWDWEGAGEAFHRALQLNPHSPEARRLHALFLASQGELQAALQEAERARELNPLSPLTNSTLALCHYYNRQYDLSEKAYLQALELDPDFRPARLGLGMLYLVMGRDREALLQLQRGVAILSRTAGLLVAARAALRGEKGRALQALQRTLQHPGEVYLSPFLVATTYTIVGDSERAFLWLDRCVEEHSEYLVYLGVDPLFDPLRSDPRFRRILRRIGLPQDRQAHRF